LVELQTTYNQEMQPDAAANSQIPVGYAAPVRPPYAGAQQAVVPSGYEQQQQQHRVAAGVHQPSSSPSHRAQQMPAQRPAYVQGQPTSAPVSSYSQPAVSHCPLQSCYQDLTKDIETKTSLHALCFTFMML